MDYEKEKKESECNCRIKIEDSIVLIVCGEVDIKQLKENLKTIIEVKENITIGDQD